MVKVSRLYKYYTNYVFNSGSQLNYVSDILVMGACLILESMILLNYCEKMGFGPLGLSGVSMGGHVRLLTTFLVHVNNLILLNNFIDGVISRCQLAETYSVSSLLILDNSINRFYYSMYSLLLLTLFYTNINLSNFFEPINHMA